MKKKEQHDLWQVLPMVVLYRDDIEILTSILSMSGNATVSFDDGTFVYETLDQICDAKGDLIRELRITATPNDDGIRCRNSSVHLQGSKVNLMFDPNHELAFLQAGDFLRTRHSWTAKVPSFMWACLAVVFLMTPLLALINCSSSECAPTLRTVTIAVALISCAIAGFWGSLWIVNRRNLIFLKKRHEYARFFKRHESTLVRALIGFGGGILGYIFRLLQE